MSIPQNTTYAHTIRTAMGAIVTVAGEHDRIYLVVRVPGSRIPLTVPIDLDPADELFARGGEIVAVQRADLARRDA